MKQVQSALADIGIPVFAGVWRATWPDQNPPVQYCVYSTTTTEASHHDDHVTSFRTFVSSVERHRPDMADTIREAMYTYGFMMLEESDKGYNQPAYDTVTGHAVQWDMGLEDKEYGH